MQKNNSSIIVTSRVRLARNLDGEIFPHLLNAENGYRVFCKIANGMDGVFPQKVYKLDSLSEDDFGIMQEKRLISPKLVKHSAISGVVISKDESVSIMINEEDHLREQCILPGLALDECYRTIDAIDSKLDAKLRFAFDKDLGFLTACVSNLGTGMRASVTLFLPALSLSGKISAVASSLKNMGIVLRGAKGEESEADGYLYQLSNSKTLGKNEYEILRMVEDACKKVAEMEKEERKIMANANSVSLKDMIYRAYAVLTGAFSLGFDEFNQMLAQVKFGAILGLLRFKDDTIFNRLSVACGPAGLAKVAGHALVGQNENIFRADYVSQMLRQNRL